MGPEPTHAPHPIAAGGGLGGDRPGAAVPAAPGPVFGRADFAKEFAGCSRAMWYIAAGILGDRSRAEDVVQDAALAAMQKLHEFQPGTSFLAWMGRFVRYTALNEARRQRMRAAAPLDESIAHTNSAGSPHRQVISASGQLIDDQSAFDDRVSSALKTLDDTARACLLLRTVLDMPYRQIAYALDIPEGTAMSHVHRSRQSLRSLLSKIDYPRGSTD